jgi:hypothetical protein
MTTTRSSADGPSQWELHPQLAADTVPVGDLALSRLLVNRDANYPWLLLVPRRSSTLTRRTGVNCSTKLSW